MANREWDWLLRRGKRRSRPTNYEHSESVPRDIPGELLEDTQLKVEDYEKRKKKSRLKEEIEYEREQEAIDQVVAKLYANMRYRDRSSKLGPPPISSVRVSGIPRGPAFRYGGKKHTFQAPIDFRRFYQTPQFRAISNQHRRIKNVWPPPTILK